MHDHGLCRLRSLLYVPASRPGMLGKLPRRVADAFVIDLEDGVAPADKQAAREYVRHAASAGHLPAGRSLLRINRGGTVWHDDDLALVEEVVPTAVVVPKAEDPAAACAIATFCERRGILTALMIETAVGVGRVRELASVHPGITALIYGSADLRLSLGARPDPARRWESHAMGEILLASRMYGCLAIDSVYFHYRDVDGLEAEARLACDLGFDGKSCIHPVQTAVVERIFSSTAEELAWARAAIAGWREQDGDRRGVVVVDGEMIEALHLDVARRILDRASE